MKKTMFIILILIFVLCGCSYFGKSYIKDESISVSEGEESLKYYNAFEYKSDTWDGEVEILDLIVYLLDSKVAYDNFEYNYHDYIQLLEGYIDTPSTYENIDDIIYVETIDGKAKTITNKDIEYANREELNELKDKIEEIELSKDNGKATFLIGHDFFISSVFQDDTSNSKYVYVKEVKRYDSNDEVYEYLITDWWFLIKEEDEENHIYSHKEWQYRMTEKDKDFNMIKLNQDIRSVEMYRITNMIQLLDSY